ncbi:MAG: RDD family protein [Chitinophagaceae bacterium]|nr:RDD family protein [Chitinophagaceae bacterium]
MSLTQQPEEHILSDFEVELDPAGRDLRFVNFIVDRLLFYLFSRGFNIFWGRFMTLVMYDEDYYVRYTLSLVVGLLLYGLFMGATEALFKGKTLGKVFTGTRVVNPDGTPVSIKMAFLRGFSRMVPFEPFSAFGGDWPRPWHDSWTNTYVVKERTSTLPQ